MNNDEKKNSTDDLLEVLKRESLGSAIDKIKDDQLNITLKEYIDKRVLKHKLNLADIHRRSGLNKSYFYALSEGKKTNPSRDVLIRLCFGFEMSLDEAQRFLKTFGAAMLYARSRRDSIIIHALDNGLSVSRCNENLDEYGEKILIGG